MAVLTAPDRPELAALKVLQMTLPAVVSAKHPNDVVLVADEAMKAALQIGGATASQALSSVGSAAATSLLWAQEFDRGQMAQANTGGGGSGNVVSELCQLPLFDAVAGQMTRLMQMICESKNVPMICQNRPPSAVVSTHFPYVLRLTRFCNDENAPSSIAPLPFCPLPSSQSLQHKPHLISLKSWQKVSK